MKRGYVCQRTSHDQRGGLKWREGCDVAACHLLYAAGLQIGAQEVWVLEAKDAAVWRAELAVNTDLAAAIMDDAEWCLNT